MGRVSAAPIVDLFENADSRVTRHQPPNGGLRADRPPCPYARKSAALTQPTKRARRRTESTRVRNPLGARIASLYTRAMPDLCRRNAGPSKTPQSKALHHDHWEVNMRSMILGLA